jgi:hypothetical protein
MLITVFLISVTAISSQEVKHAPTVEQCRADQRLWLSKLESDNGVVSIGYWRESPVTVLWRSRPAMFIPPRMRYWLPWNGWVGTKLGTVTQRQIT